LSERGVDEKMKKTTIIMSVIATLLLLEAGGLMYLSKSGYFNGAQGPQGFKGIQGERGLQGSPGIQGVKGDKGSKGDPGPRGATGETGSQGPPGKDAPVNHPPEIDLSNMSVVHHCHHYTYSIIVNVTDLDDDTLHINFYYRNDTNGSWILTYEIAGDGGVYNTSKDVCDPDSFYWMVEAWDGSDLSMRIYSQEAT
jgi:hypothetical protein